MLLSKLNSLSNSFLSGEAHLSYSGYFSKFYSIFYVSSTF